MPSSATPRPSEVRMRYFHAASSARGFPPKPTSSADAAVVASTRSSRLVTQAPQGSRVARSELGEDPFVEHGGDDRYERQVEGHPQLDRGRRSARQPERSERKPVLAQHDAQDLKERCPPRGRGSD